MNAVIRFIKPDENLNALLGGSVNDLWVKQTVSDVSMKCYCSRQPRDCSHYRMTNISWKGIPVINNVRYVIHKYAVRTLSATIGGRQCTQISHGLICRVIYLYILILRLSEKRLYSDENWLKFYIHRLIPKMVIFGNCSHSRT